MNDDRLREALRSLPRHRPRPGFARRVLRAAREDARRPGPRRGAWATAALTTAAAAAAAAVLLGVLGLLPDAGGGATAPGSAREAVAIEELRAERARLATELEELKRLAGDLRSAPEPALYLGGDERVDLVLDLGGLAAGRAADDWGLPARPTQTSHRPPVY